jgi:hypothetical protein
MVPLPAQLPSTSDRQLAIRSLKISSTVHGVVVAQWARQMLGQMFQDYMCTYRLWGMFQEVPCREMYWCQRL